MRVPPVRWAEVYRRLPEKSRKEYADDLMALAQASARMAGYFYWRSLGQDHHAAVRKSNTCVAAIRKALGYTYPRDDISF